MAESQPDYATRLSNAIEFYRQNSNAKYAPVARQFEVSPETLRRRVNGGRPAKGRPATNSKLSKAEEEALCDYIDGLNKSQVPISKKDVIDAANSIIKEHSSKLNLQPHTVGYQWTMRFLHRHNIPVPGLHVKEKKRKAAETGETIPLKPQVVIEDLDHRPRAPEKEPESSPANTSLGLCDVHQLSNDIIGSLKQLGATDDVVRKVEKLRDFAIHRETLSVQVSARLKAVQRQKTQSPSGGRASRRLRLEPGRVVRIQDARHMQVHELEDSAESAERTSEEGAQKSAQARRRPLATGTELGTSGS